MQKADVVFYLSNYRVSSVIEFTVPVYHESYVVAHALKDLNSGKRTRTALKMFNVDPWYIALYFAVIAGGILFLLYHLRSRFPAYRKAIHLEKISNFHRTTSRFLRRKPHQRPQARLFAKLRLRRICFLLYAIYAVYFFNRIFISNSFVSKNVAMDLNEIIYSERQLFKSKLVLCLFTGSDRIAFLADSPPNSLLKRINDEKFTGSKCLLNPKIIDMDAEKVKQFEKEGFLFANRPNSVVVANMFTAFSNSPYWISNEFFQDNQVQILRKSLRSNEKLSFKRFSLHLLEANIYKFFFRSCLNLSSGFQKGVAGKIFESLEELLAQNTFIASDYGSFAPLFIVLFAIELIVLIGFILSKCSTRKVRRRLLHLFHFLFRYLRGRVYR